MSTRFDQFHGPAHAFKHFKGPKASGGGGPAATTVASAPPPPTSQSVEVQMAQRDAAKQAAKKRGLSQTILAAETGGYKPLGGGSGTILSTATEKNTTLGAP